MNNKLKRFLEKFKIKYQINKNNSKLNMRSLLSKDIQNEFTDEELKGFFSKQDSLSSILDSLNQIDAKPDTTKNIETDSSGLHSLLDNTGMIPGPTGAISDVANAALYTKEGEYNQALQSSVKSLPFIGTAFAGIKKAKKASNLKKLTKKDKITELAEAGDEKGFYEAIEKANRKSSDNLNATKELDKILEQFNKFKKQGIKGIQGIIDTYSN
tara:strand:+ start:12961 stop:13599 length:639 start_codon:yes stop_codon:yes gene_type:complete